MKGLKTLFILCLCLAFGLVSVQAANILIDEDFEDGTAFENVNWAGAATSVTLTKGINIYRSGDSKMPGIKITPEWTRGELQTMTANMSSANADYNNVANTKAWRLDPSQSIKWGNGFISGPLSNPEIAGPAPRAIDYRKGYLQDAPDGGEGERIVVWQFAAAVDANAANRADGTIVGRVSYDFLVDDVNTRTISYVFTSNGDGATATIAQEDITKAGVVSNEVGTMFAGTEFKLVTTVLATSDNLNTRYSWATAVGKGFANGTTLTLPAPAASRQTRAYTFVSKDPTAAPLDFGADRVLVYDTNSNDGKGKELTGVSYEAPGLDPFYIDELYIEADIRQFTAGGQLADPGINTALEQNADLRLRPFDLSGADLTEVPVELSIFEVR